MLWYVLRVQSNKEMMVRDALAQKVQLENLGDAIGRIEVPVENVKRIRGNKQTVYKRKLYPGYVFMEMATSEDGKCQDKVWFMIKGTTGVGDFIGTDGIPTAMNDTDVVRMLRETAKQQEELPVIKVEFEKGDQIKIREGAFENFEGVVDSIDEDRGIVKVIVTIFGRSTPLDIEYWQIEKV